MSTSEPPSPTWKAINDAVKHLFDGLKNLAIAGSVLIAGRWDAAQPGTKLTLGITPGQFAGGLLMIIAIGHYIYGTFLLLPHRKNRADITVPRHRSGYGFQFWAICFYAMAAISLLTFDFK